MTDDRARDSVIGSCVCCVGLKGKRAARSNRYTATFANLNNRTIPQLHPLRSTIDRCQCLFASARINLDRPKLVVLQREVSRTCGRKHHHVILNRRPFDVLPRFTSITCDVYTIKWMFIVEYVKYDSARLDVLRSSFITPIKTYITRILDEVANCVASIFRHQVDGQLQVEVGQVMPSAGPVNGPSTRKVDKEHLAIEDRPPCLAAIRRCIRVVGTTIEEDCRSCTINTQHSSAHFQSTILGYLKQPLRLLSTDVRRW